MKESERTRLNHSFCAYCEFVILNDYKGGAKYPLDKYCRPSLNNAKHFTHEIWPYAWFSLVHKDICTHRMTYLTQFLIPVLLDPMINKIADERSAKFLLICLQEVWVKVIYDWCTAFCLCLCLCQPRFH